MKQSKESAVYHKIKTTLFFLELISGLVFLYLFFSTHLSSKLFFYVKNLTSNFYLQVLFYGILFYIFVIIFKFFFSFLQNYLLEKKFNLLRQRFLSFLGDFLKARAIEMVLMLIFILYLYFLINSKKTEWWIYLWGGWFLVSFLVAKVAPYLILPLFLKLNPLKDEDLRKKLYELADKFSLKIKDIWIGNFSSKTRKVNAFVIGLGNSKKVVLADNFLNEFTPEEIEVVCAHEFAHIKRRDSLKVLIIVGALSFIIFYLTYLSIKITSKTFGIEILKVEGLPIILLFLYLYFFLLSPFKNYLLRKIEEKADELALEVSGHYSSFISCMQKLAEKNLGEISPPRWKKFLFYSHPSIKERIEKAKRWEEKEENT